MSIIRARQPGLTRLFPHNGNRRYMIPRAGARPGPVEFSPTPGSYTAGQNITLTCETPGAEIYYTAGGQYPDGVTLYTGPIALLGDTTFKAVAKYPGGMPGVVGTAVYTVGATVNSVTWPMTSTLDGWMGVTPSTMVLGPAGFATVNRSSGTASPQIERATVSSGQTGLIWRYVRAVIKCVANPSAGSQGYRALWANQHHGYSATYSRQVQATAVAGTTYTWDWDMWGAVEVADWQGSDVIGLRLALPYAQSNPSPWIWEVDSISVYKEGFPPV